MFSHRQRDANVTQEALDANNMIFCVSNSGLISTIAPVVSSPSNMRTPTDPGKSALARLQEPRQPEIFIEMVGSDVEEDVSSTSGKRGRPKHQLLHRLRSRPTESSSHAKYNVATPGVDQLSLRI